MGKLEENKEFLTDIRKTLSDVFEHYSDEMPDNLVLQFTQNLLLIDISKSLAVIADRYSHTESAEERTEAIREDIWKEFARNCKTMEQWKEQWRAR